MGFWPKYLTLAASRLGNYAPVQSGVIGWVRAAWNPCDCWRARLNPLNKIKLQMMFSCVKHFKSKKPKCWSKCSHKEKGKRARLIFYNYRQTWFGDNISVLSCNCILNEIVNSILPIVHHLFWWDVYQCSFYISQSTRRSEHCTLHIPAFHTLFEQSLTR